LEELLQHNSLGFFCWGGGGILQNTHGNKKGVFYVYEKVLKHASFFLTIKFGNVGSGNGILRSTNRRSSGRRNISS
jgi:hypothetical protein